METIKNSTRLIFSFCLFCMAIAIAYLAYELYRFRTDFPDILVQMEKTAEVIHPTVSGIAEISRHIPPIADEIEQVRLITPSILKEIRATRQSLPGVLDRITVILTQAEETRKVLPDILAEIRRTREMIPPVLDRISGIEKQIPPMVKEINGIRQNLPQMLETIDNASASIQAFSTELAEIRKAMPAVMDEIGKTRQSLPGMLDQAERIVAQGEQFGADASKGAVNGLIMGVLNPLNLSTRLRKLVLPGRDSAELSDADIALLRETAIQVVEAGTIGEGMTWENPASRNRGSITLVKGFFEESAECREIRAEIWVRKEKTHDFNIILCRQPDGHWIEKKNPLSNR